MGRVRGWVAWFHHSFGSSMTDPDRQRTLFAVGIKHVVNTPHGRFEVRREQTTGEFRYICEICGEDFPTTQSLGSHRTYVHTRGEGAITDNTTGGDVLALLQQPAESASSVGAPEDDAELAGEPDMHPSPAKKDARVGNRGSESRNRYLHF